MFFNFGIKDIIDIVLVALMLYYLYRLMKESRSLNIFIGIMFFVLIWLMVSQVFEMRLLGGILDKLISVGVITLIILFQEEIRKFLYSLGAHQRVRGVMNFFYKNVDGTRKGGRSHRYRARRTARRHRRHGRPYRRTHQPAPHREHFLQEFAPSRWRNGYFQKTH